MFGVTFRTPPEDSTGVPHILEHSVLCGSRKFPVKEPFVDLLKGSLQTFLNAFTYPDRTCYPVASQNIKVCVFVRGWGGGVILVMQPVSLLLLVAINRLIATYYYVLFFYYNYVSGDVPNWFRHPGDNRLCGV